MAAGTSGLRPQRSAPKQSSTPTNDTKEQPPTHEAIPHSHQYDFRYRATNAEFGDGGATAVWALLAGTSAKQGSSGPRGAASDVWFATVPVSSIVEPETLPTGWFLCFLLFMIVSHNIQENKHVFPLLFHVALDVLPAQASSASCKRVFSSGKDTDTAWGKSMLPKMLEVFQVFKFIFHSERRL